MTDEIRRVGRYIGGPLLIALTIACAGVTAFSQTCPMSVNGNRLDQNTRVSSTYGFNNPICKPDAFGGEMCHIVCDYVFPAHMQTGIAVSHFRIFATWHRKEQTGARKYYSSYVCKDISDTPRYANSPNKVVDVFMDYTGATPAAQEFGRTAARQLVSALEPWAIDCPGAAAPIPPNNDPNNSCRANSERLKALEIKTSEIDGLVRFLDGHEAKERQNRDRLEYFSLMVAALNTPDYNGIHKAEVDRLRSVADYRDKALAKLGMPPGTELIDAFRQLRDVTVARIELYKQAPAKLRDLAAERVLTEAEMAKIRLDMTRAECGGRFDPASCNLTGAWLFIKGQSRETWNFQPSTAGRYTGRSAIGGIDGTAEVFYKDVILRWDNADVEGSIRIKMDDSCASGTGEVRFTGSPTAGYEISVLRQKDGGPRVFVHAKPYTVVFEGKPYDTIYQREMHANRPIDLFFFKILMPNGYQAEQNGTKLWGRFVRDPAADHPDQSDAVWWIANWRMEGSTWIANDRRGITVEVR